MAENPGHLTDAQARKIVQAALRKTRQYYRTADTIGERFEREADRLMKRKTRMSASSFTTLDKLYRDYVNQVNALQQPLLDAYSVASYF